ncbi:MAG: class I SAM-dependent methyltransferase [Candidatus Sungbacteria bacterium]|nr:class I SAM-dependent methyltransferase [Candidatus Sungbacteria bacterium]
MCESESLRHFFDLGDQPLANSLLRDTASFASEKRFPLGLVFCENCNLVQLSHVVDPRLLFVHDYVYLSSGIPSSLHFTGYAEEMRARFLPDTGKFVIEIGSNDGHLLYLIKQYGVQVLGVDPAENVAAMANERGVMTRAEFFGEATAQKIADEFGQADVIIGNNVVAHIDDHHDLMKGVVSLLSPQGVFVFEAPYLGDMFDQLAFDSVYHEHMSYLAVKPLNKLLTQYGLELFDVKPFPVQGNSLRYYAARPGTYAIEESVGRYSALERMRGFDNFSSYQKLAKSVEALREDIKGTLLRLKREGKRIAAYGAPARGNTLLNYFGIGRSVLDFATETLPSKIGKFTPGTHIPIVDISWARQNPPDYYFLLAWPYKDIILQKEKDFIAKGGKFIMPVGGERVIPK